MADVHPGRTQGRARRCETHARMLARCETHARMLARVHRHHRAYPDRRPPSMCGSNIYLLLQYHGTYLVVEVLPLLRQLIIDVNLLNVILA